MGEYAGLSKIYPSLRPGDIAGVRGSGVLRFLSEHLLKPHTDRVHFFMIGDYIEWDDDYVIMESLSTGIRTGRLSFYRPDQIEVYRVVVNSNPKMQKLVWELRKRVAAELSRVGRARYDYLLYLHLLGGLFWLMLHGKFPPYRAEQLPYGRNKEFICTEAARYGWSEVGHPIFPDNVVPTPSAFKQALLDRQMYRVYPSKNGTTVEDRPVPKFGPLTFRGRRRDVTRRDYDRVLQPRTAPGRST